jgi:hypothetical protein
LWRSIVAAALLCVASLSAISSQALASEGSPVALHLTFRKVANHVFPSTVGSGNYVGYTIYGEGIQRRFVLLDDITGKRTKITACGEPDWRLGGPWAAFDCPSQAKRWQLYNIHTHRWRRLPCDATCRRFHNLISVYAVGDKWLALDIRAHESCGDGIHYECGPETYLFYNIATGRPKTPHPAANAFIDLDSPTLTSQLCSPLSMPTGFPPPFVFNGRFAFVVSPGVPGDLDPIYVQQCGSSERTFLSLPDLGLLPFLGGFVENQYASAFCTPQVAPNRTLEEISGIYLPSLTPFTAALPDNTLCGLTEAALGPRHLYIEELRRARQPSGPPRSQRRLHTEARSLRGTRHRPFGLVAAARRAAHRWLDAGAFETAGSRSRQQRSSIRRTLP